MPLTPFFLVFNEAVFDWIANGNEPSATFRFRPEGNENVQVKNRGETSEDFHKAYLDTFGVDEFGKLQAQKLELSKMKYGVRYI